MLASFKYKLCPEEIRPTVGVINALANIESLLYSPSAASPTCLFFGLEFNCKMSSSKSNWKEASGSILEPLNIAEHHQSEGPCAQGNNPSIPHRSVSLNSHYSRPKRLRERPAHNRVHSSDSFVSPLAKIREEHKIAQRAPHLRRGIPTDTIDSLDGTFFGGGYYHHEGPYDATLAARQIPGHAPVDAVKYSNAQALAATPRANIMDSLLKHKPLQGVGLVPPGMVGPGGQIFDYEEYDVQRKDGMLGRWPGVEYLDTDIKGKGEPIFTIEEQEKALKAQRKLKQGVPYEKGKEMDTLLPEGRKRSVSDAARYPYDVNPTQSGPSSGSGMLGGLRRRLSLRRRK
ncbi:hypothetical protein BDZ91DRAFT_708468 [Kalaharituber pfeilii]|nr:hypothetical protein BDZ91DRAFT_708468 [Kalaharituber pfeilii]